MRAILFDFNGVLVDDEPLHLELLQAVLGEEGVCLGEEEFFDRYLGFSDRDCFRAVFSAADKELQPAHLERLIARKATYYQQRIREEGFAFFPGAEALVIAAADADLMLGVVSGALRAEVEGALRQLGLRELFKTVVTAENVAAGKPHPEGYSLGLQNLSSLPPLPSRLFHPHEVLAIEDSPAGLAAAAAAGLATLGVAHTYPLERLAMADHGVETIGELSLGQLRRLFSE